MKRLVMEDVCAGYGESIVLDGIDLVLEAGSSLAVLGRNGMGKTSLLLTLMGLTRLHRGRILLAGTDISAVATYRRAALGLAWTPQERGIFAPLTVDENLQIAARPGYWTIDRVYERFPQLGERRRHAGNQLSGGEQQMLALGRALVINPSILLLDEPLEGLAPLIASQLLRMVETVMRDSGISVIIVEQRPQQILPITAHALVLDRGRIVYRSRSSVLLTDSSAQERWLGLAENKIE